MSAIVLPLLLWPNSGAHCVSAYLVDGWRLLQLFIAVITSGAVEPRIAGDTVCIVDKHLHTGEGSLVFPRVCVGGRERARAKAHLPDEWPSLEEVMLTLYVSW